VFSDVLGECSNINECDSDILNYCDLINGECEDRMLSGLYPLGYSCSCITGYQLADDGFTCIDINECS
jgi:fibulin 1/2